MRARATVEDEIISHQTTTIENRCTAAAADLSRIIQSRVAHPDLPYPGPTTSDPSPKSATTLFFRHFLDNPTKSAQSAPSPYSPHSSPDSSPRSSIFTGNKTQSTSMASSITQATSTASSIIPPPLALSGQADKKPAVLNKRTTGRRT